MEITKPHNSGGSESYNIYTYHELTATGIASIIELLKAGLSYQGKTGEAVARELMLLLYTYAYSLHHEKIIPEEELVRLSRLNTYILFSEMALALKRAGLSPLIQSSSSRFYDILRKYEGK